MKQIQALSVDKIEKRIEQARRAYYRGMPIMTDAEYDKLEDSLRKVAPKSKVLKSGGYDVPTKMKVKLPYVMPSLIKIKYGQGTVEAWAAKNKGPYCVSVKLDGISMLLVYNKDNIKAYTRGRSGGTTGGDISHLVPHMKIPQKQRSKVVVRGEFIMKPSKFEAWKKSKENKEGFANPRNMGGGVTNRMDVHKAIKDFDFVAYELLEPRLKPSAAMAKLKALGFKVPAFKVLPTITEDKLLGILQKVKSSYSYEADGLVVTVDKVNPIAKSDPEWSRAFKSDSENASAKSVVLEVEWNLTRLGLLFPRLRIKPISIGGVTVEYLSGKSAKFIKDNKIGVGAIIKVRRSGDVIPDITSEDVLRIGKPSWPPKADYEWYGAHIKSTKAKKSDVDAVTMRLSHFFKVLGLDRFKDATIEKYVDQGYNTPKKILDLPQKKFVSIEGVSRLSAVVYEQLQSIKANGVAPWTLMYASGLFGRGFGSRNLKAIVKAMPLVVTRGMKGQFPSVEEIDSIPGFDELMARKFVESLPKFCAFARKLDIPMVMEKVKTSSAKLKGVRAMFTGFRSKELEAEIEKNGGEVVTSIGKATVLLVADKNSTSLKAQAAKQAGIPLMDEQGFRKKWGL